MPRPNRQRSVHAEAQLAQHIVVERDRLGWTNESLAKRMTDLGCPIRDSAIYKIEKGEPRRRITVDELVGFALAFDMSVIDLLLGRSGGQVGFDATGAVHDLENLYSRREALLDELKVIGQTRDQKLGDLKDILGSDKDTFENFRDWIATDFRDWADFLEWSGIDRVVSSGRRPTKGMK
jgi:hypothetical protein